MIAKRKRSANFTAEEKLRFVRLLRKEGQCIVSKVTAHDATTNKEKELAWTKITKIHNSSGDMMRTAETLKKLWGKLKSESKTYKAASRHPVSSTGGSSPKKYDDQVLELVTDLIGRASSGSQNILDNDAEVKMENDGCAIVSPDVDYLDDSILDESFREDKVLFISVENVKAEDKNNPIEYEEEPCPSTSAPAESDQMHRPKAPKWADRRRPDLAPNANIRKAKIKKKERESNRFTAESSRVEQEKCNLIRLQNKQMTELHEMKMQNEKLKKELLKTLLKKVSDAHTNDAPRMAIQFLFKDNIE